VNEILKAGDADNKDTKDLNTKIDQIQSFVEDDLCVALKNAEVLSKEEAKDYKNGIWKWANLQRKTWLQKNKIIAFVGEFSAGKTSIVNRILSQDDDNAPQLPVSSKATTAIATYISYGNDFLSQFTDPTGKLKNIEKSTFEKVNKDILAEVNVSSLIQYFVMKYKNKNLENLSILDTPGFSSNDKEDAKRTSDVIREADVLFWVLDANAGEINQTSLETIQKNLQGLPLFIVINKADTKSKGELSKLEDHIKETIRKNGISVNGYIHFSQKERVEKLMDAIRSVSINGTRKNTFIYEPYGKLVQQVMELNEKCSTARNKRDLLEKGVETCIEEISECLSDVQDKCKDVAKMPKRQEKIFVSDYYKISKEDYSEFLRKLRSISGDSVEKISTLKNELNESVESLHTAKSEWNEAKNKRKKMEDITAQLDKLLKAWNPNYLREFEEYERLNN
jgi:predicted GTPase